MSAKYVPAKGGSVGIGSSLQAPNYNVNGSEFSSQPRSHPTNYAWEGGRGRHAVEERRPPTVHVASPFRCPQPSKVSILRTEADPAARARARRDTEKQAAQRRAEVRRRRADAWSEAEWQAVQSGGARTAPSALSRSEPLLPSTAGHVSAHVAQAVSRQEFERQGLLIGRYAGQPADGRGGVAQRKHNSLTFRKSMFARPATTTASWRSSSTSTLRSGGRCARPWMQPNEGSAPHDLVRVLPVPRGGWDSLPPSSWTEPEAAGSREFRECF